MGTEGANKTTLTVDRGNTRTVPGAANFLEALCDAGVKYCFVNLGSDHPAIIEAIASANIDSSKKVPKIITCPSELVALSAALGYAQVTGHPQCVIVHVDCGTLALGQSVHNASVGRVPVLMFAGLSPVTQEGEMLGSRTEFIHWLQDVPDQAGIVRQYCRYTSEIRVGHNIKQMVNRALQIAQSDPRGPVYLTASREALEQPVAKLTLDQERWGPTIPTALPISEIEMIGTSLIESKRPLVITGYLGRNTCAPPLLESLCDRLPIEVLEVVGSDVCISSAHEAYRGVTITTHPLVVEADVILVMDCDVPWIPTKGKPSPGARIFHFDVDPLKQQMSLFYIDAHRRYKVSCENVLKQLIEYLDGRNWKNSEHDELFISRSERYRSWREELRSLEVPSPQAVIEVPYLMSELRKLLPQNTTVVIEAVTNALSVIHHLNLTKPGTLLGTGAGGLGWLGGAALGVKLAKRQDFVCGIVGDGTFFFSQMESAFWVARRYGIPILLIVLNNGGWSAPKVSTLHVHQNGLASKSNRKDLSLSLEPSPDYPQIACAAGDAWGVTIDDISNINRDLALAVKTVQGGRCAVVEVRVPPLWPES